MVTYVWSADCEVSINSHHSQQANTGHAKKDVESCIDLKETQKQRKQLVCYFVTLIPVLMLLALSIIIYLFVINI